MKKKTVRLASGVIPLVSAKPQFRVIPRQWGIMPVWGWQDRMGRRREATESKTLQRE